jgi:GNAT superfamily N-acetyltransferase
MTKTNKVTPWGIVYYYDQEEFSFTLHFYDDDPITAYLANVKVAEKYRGIGFGNKILKLADKEAHSLGATHIILEAKKREWMYEWYSRHGYCDYGNVIGKRGIRWMKHIINNK